DRADVWAPAPDVPPGHHAGQRAPLDAPGLSAGFCVPDLRPHALPPRTLVACDEYVHGDVAWAVTVERPRAAPRVPPHGPAPPRSLAVYHLVLLDGRWRLTARIELRHRLGSGGAATAGGDAGSASSPILALVARYRRARAGADWRQSAECWAPVSWSFRA